MLTELVHGVMSFLEQRLHISQGVKDLQVHEVSQIISLSSVIVWVTLASTIK